MRKHLFKMTDTITCLLCQGVVAFNEHDQSRYKSHLSLEHKAFYFVPWLIAKTIEEFEKKSVGSFEKEEKYNFQNVSVKPVGTFERKEENNSQKVSVSIIKVNSGEEVSMEEACVDVKKEVIDVLDNMNTENMKCTLCEKNFSAKRSLKRHLVKIHGRKPVKDESVDTNDSISGNMKSKQNECTLCNKTLSSKSKLKRHLSDVHSRNPENPKPYQCSVCNKSFKTKSYVEVHEKKHADTSSADIQEEELSGDNSFGDVQEELSETADSSSLEVSMEEEREDVKKDENFTLDNMNTEELLVDNESVNISNFEDKNEKMTTKKECTDCNKQFSSRKNLKRHIETIHSRNPENPNPYQCTVCDKSFKTKSYVEVHEKKHTGETADRSSLDIQDEEFQCGECPKVFRTELYMKTHQKSHTLDLAHIDINLDTL